ncbi:ATP-binding cassette sub-family C member 5-like [Antedon mediterranea]|uniref:ATP-binding cassette sub-family C member 5-like n=1 Tax=Antedon mediterranea TaxID=105859 RepID=UPI003AF7A9E1
MTKQRGKYSKITANRVKIMNEILTYTKLIKMYVWENSFAAKVREIRKEELKQLRKVSFLHGLTLTFVYSANPTAMVTIMLTMVFTGRDISVPELFGLIVCFTTLANIVHTLPVALKPTTEALVTLRKIQKILQLKDHSFSYGVPCDSENAIEISSASFSYNVVDTDKVRDVESSNEKVMLNSLVEPTPVLLLNDINIKVKKSSLIGICGPIGSGKTSLLNAFLGQLPIVNGHVAATGRFCYVPQQAWIMNATIRENITFNEDFEPIRYAEIIEACCLTDDLAVLELGDKTEIGERGINLSGGQKQRVNLARALYSGGDIMLLDDPMSAVDAHVGKHIFNQCIRGLMKNKTVVLITHQLQYLQYCDEIFHIRAARVSEHGSHEDLMGRDTEYKKLIQAHYSNTDTSTKEQQPTNNKAHSDGHVYLENLRNSEVGLDSPAELGKLISKEDAGFGAGKLSYLWKYINYSGGVPALVIFILLSIAASSTTLAVNLTLTVWIDAGTGSFNTSGTNYSSGDLHLNPDFPKYLTAYCVAFISIFVFGIVGTIYNITIFHKASTKLHSRMFKKIIRAKMKFFDTTPVGRILNRFSKDMDEIDNSLPGDIDYFVSFAFTSLGFLFVISYIWNVYICILLFLVTAYIMYTRFFSPGYFNLKRLENTTSSLTVSHVTATVQGSATIQAYNKIEQFQRKFEKLLSDNTTSVHLKRASLLWAWFRLEVLTVISLVSTALFVVFNQGTISPSVAGLLLTLSFITTTGLSLLVLQFFLQISLRLISVERVEEYIQNVKPEETLNVHSKPADWIVDGRITFNGYSMRYRENVPASLIDITLTFDAGTKVGIVGRTGSGKSSLGVALYRLADRIEGSITIDDTEIHEIKLKDLRRRISIIPQDPVLFAGTVRYNLDPFDEFSDDEIWQAFEKTHVKELICSLGEQLAAPVIENGENFSVGERQLICMARALLRKNKILILDEATAAIDTETDSKIQQTIRECFTNCTLLIIAHRLNTVLDCDTILVMDGGRVAEIGNPDVLLANSNSVLNKLNKSYLDTVYNE